MKLVRVWNFYINAEAVAFVTRKTQGLPGLGKEVTTVQFVGGGKPLEIPRYIDDVLEALGWQGESLRKSDQT